MFEVREELENYKWFWGEMNRADSETKMRAEGEVGNFAIRLNANGHYVMTFWRADGIHHHKIIHQIGIFRFEKTAVRAEGNSLVDLLDNYMKNCIDKKIVPIGGVLHLVYDEAWNPPEIDHDQLQRKLLARNDMRDRRKFLQDVLQTPQSPSAPSTQSKNPRRKKEEYTVVSPTTGVRESDLTQTLPPGSSFQQEIKFKMSEKSGKVPPQPPLKPTATQDGKKPLPKPPVKKKKPAAEGKEVAAEPMGLPVSDKRNNPLPPTPPEISPIRAGSGGSSPKPGRPKPLPRGGDGDSGKMTSSSSLSPSWANQKSSPTSPSPPPPEQAVYENTDFSSAREKRVKNKKLPPTPPNTKPSGHTPSLGDTPSSVTSDPELDVGGQDVYENTAFGDMSQDGGDLYANVPVSQQRKEKTHNGHHPHPPYKNVGHSEPQPAAPDTGTPYQNIHHPKRGRRRKH
ncbi:hypothetical protein GBAR_LOCUS13007 [Geodia barretti]|nr:hypothetical protein GBAR_LOCUS13007 [Geodia barretti]